MKMDSMRHLSAMFTKIKVRTAGISWRQISQTMLRNLDCEFAKPRSCLLRILDPTSSPLQQAAEKQVSVLEHLPRVTYINSHKSFLSSFISNMTEQKLLLNQTVREQMKPTERQRAKVNDVCLDKVREFVSDVNTSPSLYCMSVTKTDPQNAHTLPQITEATHGNTAQQKSHEVLSDEKCTDVLEIQPKKSSEVLLDDNTGLLGIQQSHEVLLDDNTGLLGIPLDLQWIFNPRPRSPLIIDAFPASFLPTSGASLSKEAMCHKGSRLASLSLLPGSCNVSRIRLAEAGFYYDNTKTNRDVNNVHEVVCFSCEVAYSQWNSSDNPTEIHRRLNPDCAHVKSLPVPSTHEHHDSSASLASSSIPNAQGASSSVPSLSVWDSIPWNSYSSGYGTRTSAGTTDTAVAESGTSVGGNAGGDLATDCSAQAPDPLPTNHYGQGQTSNQSALARAPRDGHATSPAANQRTFPARDMSGARMQDLEDRPPLVMSQAVYPQFSRQQERRATFTNWPLNHCFHPDDLVMQGFYYAGYADCIRCFYCGVGLKSWDERDDVMKEHIRWRPSCGYILNTKGRQFVSNTQRSLQVENSPQASNPQGNIAASFSTDGTSALVSGTTSTTARTTEASHPTRPSATSGTATPDSQNALHHSGSGATISPGATTSTPNPHTTPRRTPNDVAGQTSARSDSANAAVLPSSLPSENASSASASATACGNVGVQASREVLRKVEEMGFSKDSIAQAVRHLQRTGVARVSADELVETILAVNASDTATTLTDNTENNVETDGDSTSQNHTTLQSEHAQIVMSENERLRARQTCKICHEARVGMIFLPCGHVVACTQCGARTRHCTNCGQFIRATANVYMS